MSTTEHAEDTAMPDRPDEAKRPESVEEDDGETRERDATRDMLQTISDVSAHLCEIEEE